MSDWDQLDRHERDAYPAMVSAMERVGIRTFGRPPIWAWGGAPTLLDAYSLFDAEHELGAGYPTVEFEVARELVFLSDYGDWCDYLAARFDAPAVWDPLPVIWSTPDLPQACVPYLCAEWVREVRNLPTTGWDDLALEQPA